MSRPCPSSILQRRIAWAGFRRGEHMSAVRRSLLLATGENYVAVAVSLATLAVVSRLLSPHEIGVYALGVATIAIALALREFATTEFLVQRQEVSRDDV